MEVLRRDTADPVIDQLPETILQQEERGRGTKEALEQYAISRGFIPPSCGRRDYVRSVRWTSGQLG